MDFGGCSPERNGGEGIGWEGKGKEGEWGKGNLTHSSFANLRALH